MADGLYVVWEEANSSKVHYDRVTGYMNDKLYNELSYLNCKWKQLRFYQFEDWQILEQMIYAA